MPVTEQDREAVNAIFFASIRQHERNDEWLLDILVAHREAAYAAGAAERQAVIVAWLRKQPREERIPFHREGVTAVDENGEAYWIPPRNGETIRWIPPQEFADAIESGTPMDKRDG